MSTTKNFAEVVRKRLRENPQLGLEVAEEMSKETAIDYTCSTCQINELCPHCKLANENGIIGFGCNRHDRHPNFTKLVAEVERLRKKLAEQTERAEDAENEAAIFAGQIDGVRQDGNMSHHAET